MRQEIAGAVAKARELAASRPVSIVFANGDYEPVLANWFAHAEAAGASNVLTFALDEKISSFAAGRGLPFHRLPAVSSRRDLWVLRTEVFEALAAAGVDFIHSDADAIWLRNPCEHLFPPGADMTFSPGTRHPPDVANQWGFVLCCGLFAVRGGDVTAGFFKAVRDRATTDGDDQVAVNRTLRDQGIAWQPAEGERLEWNGRPFHAFSRTRVGRTADLAVAVLPHAQFPRLPEPSPDAIVWHPTGKDPVEARLRRLGLWRI